MAGGAFVALVFWCYVDKRSAEEAEEMEKGKVAEDRYLVGSGCVFVCVCQLVTPSAIIK